MIENYDEIKRVILTKGWTEAAKMIKEVSHLTWVMRLVRQRQI